MTSPVLCGHRIDADDADDADNIDDTEDAEDVVRLWGTDRPDDSMIHASARPCTGAPAVPAGVPGEALPGASGSWQSPLMPHRLTSGTAFCRQAPALRAQTGTRSNSHHGFRVGVVHF